MKSDSIQFRCVRKQSTGERYLHIEDVCNMLREFGATEETDVRNRINELIDSIKESAFQKS